MSLKTVKDKLNNIMDNNTTTLSVEVILDKKDFNDGMSSKDYTAARRDAEIRVANKLAEIIIREFGVESKSYAKSTSFSLSLDVLKEG